jgi:hypothetical protein
MGLVLDTLGFAHGERVAGLGLAITPNNESDLS